MRRQAELAWESRLADYHDGITHSQWAISLEVVGPVDHQPILGIGIPQDLVGHRGERSHLTGGGSIPRHRFVLLAGGILDPFTPGIVELGTRVRRGNQKHEDHHRADDHHDGFAIVVAPPSEAATQMGVVIETAETAETAGTAQRGSCSSTSRAQPPESPA